MQLLHLKETFAFMSYRKMAMIFSLLLMLGSAASMLTKGMNWGIDFTGGTLIQVGFEQPADLVKVRALMKENGFDDALVSTFGSSRDVLIRLAPRADIKAQFLSDQVLEVLKKGDDGNVEMQRIEFVGPSVGDELKEQGALAMMTALICILVYVAFRFEWRFALGAVAALIHDVTITVGLFSLLGKEFDLTVLAAILAVIGYSLNDTIVVSDRIRENFRKIRKGTPSEIIDESLTQTLSRTVITSLTTVLVLLALYFQGGSLINGFASALLFGVFIGTYSSIYVASSVALSLGVSKEDLMQVEIEKEGADQESVM
ncbi:MAG: preprotein translocase subunit SecF [Phenylobacterium sp.]|jgi:preprotein translocase subunit SecF